MNEKKRLNLPEAYPLVVGDTFELFYRGVILANDPYHYHIKVSCPKGAAYRRKYVFTPTAADVGEHILAFQLSDDYGNVLEQRDVKLAVNPTASSPAKKTHILCMGASVTAGGQWPSECLRRLCGNGGTPAGLALHNIAFVGTCQGQPGVCFEGYGGWQWESYNSKSPRTTCFRYIYGDHGKTDLDQHSVYTDGFSQWKLETIEAHRIKIVTDKCNGDLPESGILRYVSGGNDHKDISYTKVADAAGNPFWNLDKDRVDFTAYAEKLGVPQIDICVILLGWNNWKHDKDHIQEQVRIFIGNLRRDQPDCKIVLVAPNPPSSQDGFGMNYGANWNYYEKLKFAFSVDSWYQELCKEYENVYAISLAGQFDSEYSYPTITRQVNSRSRITETVQSNGVHPSAEGYDQIADAVFRQLNALL